MHGGGTGNVWRDQYGRMNKAVEFMEGMWHARCRNY